MVGLLKNELRSGSSILDTCIGPNTFFKAMYDDFINCKLKGVEIDTDLISEETKRFFL